MEPIYANVIFWAAFLFVRYTGYGDAVVRLVNRSEFNDFGLAMRSAAGMSASIILGSVLMVFKAATPEGLTSVAVVGFGLAIWAFYLQFKATSQNLI